MCKIEQHLFVVVPGNNVENLLGDCEKMTSFVHLFTHLFAVEGAVWLDPTFSFLNHSHLPCSHLIPTCHLIFFMYPCLSDHRSRTQQNSDSERLQIHDCHRSENRKSLKQQRRSANSSKLKRLEVPRSDSASTSNSLQKLHTLHCLVYLVVVAMGSCMKANRRLASERKKKMEEAQRATDLFCTSNCFFLNRGISLCENLWSEGRSSKTSSWSKIRRGTTKGWRGKEEKGWWSLFKWRKTVFFEFYCSFRGAVVSWIYFWTCGRRTAEEEKRKREEIARNLKEEALQKAAEEERLKDQRKAEEEHRRALQELQIEDERKRREEEQRIAEQRRQGKDISCRLAEFSVHNGKKC